MSDLLNDALAVDRKMRNSPVEFPTVSAPLAPRVMALEAKLEICRNFYNVIEAIAWRTFADQGKDPSFWGPTEAEKNALYKARVEFDSLFPKWHPQDTPENRSRCSAWGIEPKEHLVGSVLQNQGKA